MKARVMLALSSAALLVVLGACGAGELTNPLTPSSSAEFALLSATPTAGSDGVVLVLKRTAPLRSDLTASGVIGPRGGHLQIPGAGLRVTFGRGAVATPTLITVTAARGDAVAYEFQPHGLKFRAPVVLRQNLRKTAAAGDDALAASLQGSYFEGGLANLFVDDQRRRARSKETRRARLDKRARALEFSIEHFSGYMVSVGLAGVKVDIEVQVP